MQGRHLAWKVLGGAVRVRMSSEATGGTVLVLVLPMCVSYLRCQWSLLVFDITIYK